MAKEKNNPNNKEGSHDSGTDLQDGESKASEISIGLLLKNEREKRGLSLEQVSEITKLRPSMLKILEDEAWEELPSPAFASGFVRSYGHALGLEDKLISERYSKSGPVKVSAPKPLSKTMARKKMTPLIWVFLLLAICSFYFFWRAYAIKGNIAVTTTGTEHEKGNELKSSEPLTNAIETGEAFSNARLKNENSLNIIHKTSEIDLQEKLLEPENDSGLDRINTLSNRETDSDLTLKIDIKEETWIKIFIDDKEGKEYMLRPGSPFIREAEKGFEILIGNAGGIDLELNGKKIEKIGETGQFVRLRLPDTFRRIRSKE